MLGSVSSNSMVDFQNPMILGSGEQTVVVISGGGTATVATVNASLSGNISGSGGLTIVGNGELVLTGTDNTYSGGTVVDSGTLIIASNGGIPDEGLTIGAGGTFIFDPSVVANDDSLTASRGQGVAPVPEPGTLVLLVAGMAVRIGWRRRICNVKR